ncbi:MAG: DUF5686 family protein [Bacteroidota bacterium]
MMLHTRHAVCALLLMLPFVLMAQSAANYQVFDKKTMQPVPFATIRFGETGQGTVASLEGKFEVPAPLLARAAWIEVSCLGYEPQKQGLPLAKPIYLVPSGNTLGEVVIKPPLDKIRRVLNKAIANKSHNNPDKYDWYRCHVYYKMAADLGFNDFVMKDTSADSRERQNLVNTQHVAMSETYSIRTWERPQKLQEDVLASRFSGFKQSVFTSLVTDFLPFHAYKDYIKLNGIDFHNPVSRGYEQYYSFALADELQQGTDTLWILSFRPRGNNANGLKGTVYINSDGFAISQLIAQSADTTLKMAVRIEQQYERVPAPGGARWFPRQLNYILNWQQGEKDDKYTIYMKGNSLIDSVSFDKDRDFKFDRSHTVRVATGADQRPDSAWAAYRAEALSAKEQRTYKVMDSLGEEIKLDKIMGFLAKLPEGRVPIGMFDVELKRLFSYNDYEHVRLGMGLLTNERFVKWLSIGGWAGYGFKDAHWKYGGSAEVYLDRHKEFVLRGSYTDDISDPGRIQLHRDLDKNYLRMYLLQRVDNIKAWSGSMKMRFGYWNFELAATDQWITPLYSYAFSYLGSDITSFAAREASLGIRYAFAERTSPFFGRYYSMGSNYPVWYGKVTTGRLNGGVNRPYTQALTAVAWHKHINRLGYEHLLVEAGRSWSDGPLPLTKLFAGNGYRYDTKGLAFYAFGGMPTMYPYAYYTDQFISVVFRHDMDRKLYKTEVKGTGLSSAPNVCLQYGLLYGTLSDRGAHKYVPFGVPDNAYHEGGLMLNNLLRLRYFDLYYLTLNVGYFYHITDAPIDVKQHGRAVFGAGIEL